MKISHVISSIDKTSGGTSMYMKSLIEGLNYAINQVLISFNSSKNINIDSSVICFFSQKNYCSRFYSKSMIYNLKTVSTDVFHGNGMWEYPVHIMSKTAIRRKIPYIISTHGMLEPWSLQQGALKKKLVLKLFQYKDLAKATCLHATAHMEVESIRNLGLKNPIAMIPNGVNILEFPKEIPLKAHSPKKILFLSRIVKNKGVEELIEAWSIIELKLRENWQIEIIGNGGENYIHSLQLKINELQLQQQISIKPPVFGKEKIKFFREASLFVLPTFSENFGIVIAEALASYTPVITTKGTPWEELNSHNAGWWIDIGVEPLKQALEAAIQTKDSELITMGKNGRKLIENKYSMEAVVSQMIQLYQWVLGKTDKPDFVIAKETT